MKQVSQDLRSGRLRVDEVPTPTPGPGEILVAVRASLISPGTERAAAEVAQKSLLGKALERPADVKRVLEKVRRDGLAAAYRAVTDRLDTPLALGYSAAGIVVAVGAGIEDLAAGDPVACAGQGYASHAEWVSVPRNLCAKIPSDGDAPLDFETAAFATLGAIALHAIRQSEAKLGETIAVVGLGLIGNLAGRLLQAAGCRVIGIEPDAFRRERARADETCTPAEAEARIRNATRGRGVDAVIVTASSSDATLLESATRLCRDRGRLVVLGAVPLQLGREVFYRREIELRVSRSYGPGRYDPSYEERGVDYPIGYVRWTEQRNLEAFLDLARGGRLGISSLVTHRFAIADAGRAYQLLLDDREPSLGILIEYGAEGEAPPPASRTVTLRGPREGRFGVGFLGAGQFAQAVLLPPLRGERDVVLRAVATKRGLMAKHVAERFGFERAATDVGEILADSSIDTVFVAGPHSVHGPHIVAALRAGKHVFAEKPLCVRESELRDIEATLAATPQSLLMVGFNRRFAPATEAVRRHFAASGGPDAAIVRVNAGPGAATGWGADRENEGGRIVGEGCHFVDLLTVLFGGPPRRVHAARAETAGASPDDVIATLEFSGGRIGTIAYLTSGSTRVPKERIEVFGGGRTAVIDDFRSVTLLDGGTRTERTSGQDKGHRAELAAFFAALRAGGPPPIPYAELSAVTRATLAIEESARCREPIDLAAPGR